MVNQIDVQGRWRHLLTLEGLKRAPLFALIQQADTFLAQDRLQCNPQPVLAGKTVANLFFEPSTRTRCSFELAAKRLGAHVVNWTAESSSTTKGETLLDTVQNLRVMGVDAFVIRHPQEGAAQQVAEAVEEQAAVINAGDGCHAHPTQGLLDMLTIYRHKGDFSPLVVAIIGDVLHSRVARSQVQALQILGAAEIRIVAPSAWVPQEMRALGTKLRIYENLEEGIRGADVLMLLRVQRERIKEAFTLSESAYFQEFGLTGGRLRLAKPDALVMHPGPMNRGVEVESAVADSPQSVILEQTRNGVALRMAVLLNLLGERKGDVIARKR